MEEKNLYGRKSRRPGKQVLDVVYSGNSGRDSSVVKRKKNVFESKIVTTDSDKSKMIKRLYIQNSIKYKENCHEDLEMLRHHTLDFKNLAGTVLGNINTAGNNLRRQNKQIMGFIKQNSDLEKFIEKNFVNWTGKRKQSKFNDSTLSVCMRLSVFSFLFCLRLGVCVRLGEKWLMIAN